MLNKLLTFLSVWYLTKDGIRHQYDPSDHFWKEPFISEMYTR